MSLVTGLGVFIIPVLFVMVGRIVGEKKDPSDAHGGPWRRGDRRRPG
jgi:hypothetical protein